MLYKEQESSSQADLGPIVFVHYSAHCQRLLAGGSIVQVDKGLVIDVLVQNGEVCPHTLSQGAPVASAGTIAAVHPAVGVLLHRPGLHGLYSQCMMWEAQQKPLGMAADMLTCSSTSKSSTARSDTFMIIATITNRQRGHSLQAQWSCCLCLALPCRSVNSDLPGVALARCRHVVGACQLSNVTARMSDLESRLSFPDHLTNLQHAESQHCQMPCRQGVCAGAEARICQPSCKALAHTVARIPCMEAGRLRGCCRGSAMHGGSASSSRSSKCNC